MAVKQRAQTMMVVVRPGVVRAKSGDLLPGLAPTDSFYTFSPCLGGVLHASAMRNQDKRSRRCDKRADGGLC